MLYNKNDYDKTGTEESIEEQKETKEETILEFLVAICDDEAAVCSKIEKDLAPYIDKNKIKTEIFYDGEKLYESLAGGATYDLIFLDIELPGMNGVQISDKIRNELQNERTHIVFISVKQEYAIELFAARPLDFLVKPILAERIIEVTEKAMKLTVSYNTNFDFRVAQLCFSIPYGEIIYFESKGRKIYICTQEKKYKTYGKLDEIEQIAPATFIRIHKSYLINQIYIREWQYEQMVLADGSEFGISQFYRKTVRQKLLRKGRRGN